MSPASFAAGRCTAGLYAEGIEGHPKWIEITLHSHIAGRPTLQPVIRKCFEYAKSHSDVWFARRKDIAEWTLRHEGGLG